MIRDWGVAGKNPDNERLDENKLPKLAIRRVRWLCFVEVTSDSNSCRFKFWRLESTDRGEATGARNNGEKTAFQSRLENLKYCVCSELTLRDWVFSVRLEFLEKRRSLYIFVLLELDAQTRFIFRERNIDSALIPPAPSTRILR